MAHVKAAKLLKHLKYDISLSDHSCISTIQEAAVFLGLEYIWYQTHLRNVAKS